jgi:hypothetical protein
MGTLPAATRTVGKDGRGITLHFATGRGYLEGDRPSEGVREFTAAPAVPTFTLAAFGSAAMTGVQDRPFDRLLAAAHEVNRLAGGTALHQVKLEELHSALEQVADVLVLLAPILGSAREAITARRQAGALPSVDEAFDIAEESVGVARVRMADAEQELRDALFSLDALSHPPLPGVGLLVDVPLPEVGRPVRAPGAEGV